MLLSILNASISTTSDLSPYFRFEILIKKIIEMDILEKNGIIIIHRKKGDSDNYPKKFKVIDTKSYGLSTFVFGKKSN